MSLLSVSHPTTSDLISTNCYPWQCFPMDQRIDRVTGRVCRGHHDMTPANYSREGKSITTTSRRIITSSSCASSSSLSSYFIIFVFLLISCYLNDLCSCFNLEPRLPVIKRGDPSSYFGFSVAQHLTVDETRRKISDALWVFIFSCAIHASAVGIFSFILLCIPFPVH